MSMMCRKNNSCYKIQLDPRTKLYMLVIGTISLVLAPTLGYEVALVLCAGIFGLLCDAKYFTLKMSGIYMLLVVLNQIATYFMSGWFQIAVITFTFYIRKIFPCAMIGGIMVGTTRVNEFMAAMNRIHLSKSIVIPMTVMLRYFPTVKEDWGYIKDAMRMRDVAPTIKSFLFHPMRTIECVYVPMMMSALKVADELSAASITRGLENSKDRTCMTELHFTLVDLICAGLFTVFLGVGIWLILMRGGTI